jgi:hypothetical protein
MADYFHDTSAIAKHYHVEASTPTVDQLLAEPASRHLVSRLGIIELHSVFASKVRMGVISPPDFQLLRARLLADVAQGLLQVVRMDSAHYQRAEQLLTAYAPTHRLRTLDALQLSVALDLHSRGMLDHFVCSDRGLIQVATAEGLSVIAP